MSAIVSGDSPVSEPGDAPARVRSGDLTRYATGSIGMGLWVTVPGLLLLYFLTQTLDVPPLIAGLTLLLPKVVDVVVHPLLGTLSDRQARRRGHRRGLLRWGLLLAVAWIGLFSVPAHVSGTAAALWVGCFYVAGNFLFGCFQVPYLTTPSDLRIGYHERSRVFMYRMVFLTLGLLFAGVAAPALVAADGRGAYARMSVALAVVLVASSLVAVGGVRRLTENTGVQLPGERVHSAFDDVRVAWRDREFRSLLLSYLFTGTTTHLFLAAVPFYAQYVLHHKGLTAVLMGAFLVPATVSGPGWLRVSRRIGKQRGLLVAQSAFFLGSLLLLPGRALGTAATVAVVFVMGAAFAGLQLFAFSMLSDAVASAEARGTARAGAYTGVWTATEASGTAVGPYLFAAVLAIGGFVSTSDNHVVPQTHAAVHALEVGFTLVPAVLMGVAYLFQRRYRLDAVAAAPVLAPAGA